MSTASGESILATDILAQSRVMHTLPDTPKALSLEAARELAQRHGVTLAEVQRTALWHHVCPERYLKNLGLMGYEGQLRLLESAVAVAGAGGLGGWVIEGLARMGVGRLEILDGDVFEESNLNRQLGATESSLGRIKVDDLAQRVATVNSAVVVRTHHIWLDEANAPAFLQGVDVVVDALDTLPARFVLERAAMNQGMPLVHGAIGGYTGQVMTILPGDPGLKAIYGETPPVERGVEVALGNPAATPMMVAAWQIQEVIKLLIHQGVLIRRRMLLLDAEAGDVTEIRFA